MIKMACGYQSYLISAVSPPGFELLSYSKNYYDNNQFRSSFNSHNSTHLKKSRFSNLKHDLLHNEGTNGKCDYKSLDFLLGDTRINGTRDQEKDQQRISEWELAYECTKPCCNCQEESINKLIDAKNKKIKFADEEGKDLCEVKIASEPSDVPPILSISNHLKFDEQEDKSKNINKLTDLDENETKFHIKLLNFKLLTPQEIRERMYLNVCLEYLNCNGDQLIGRVVTKNYMSEKKLYIRYTTNKWNSVTDEICKLETSGYVVNVYGYEYEMFTFEMPLEVFKIPVEIEMAICYIVDGLEYWDNNNEDNYIFMLEDILKQRPLIMPSIFKCSMPDNFVENSFSDDCMFGNDLPYW